tara:strand:+ start:138 stop:401 length:264 start_codon:yes stop_codon:yes gene_type:complete
MILAERIFLQSAPEYVSRVHIFASWPKICDLRGEGCKFSQVTGRRKERIGRRGGRGGSMGEGEGDEEGPELDSSGDESIMPVKRRRP